MENIKEIIKELNDLKILQKNIELEEDLPEDVYNKYFKDSRIVLDNFDVDKHRWYETYVRIYQIEDTFIGILYVAGLFSEESSVDDIYHHLIFDEYEEIPAVTYIIKEDEE